MQKSEFISNAVNILYLVMVQSTIALENYTNKTKRDFIPRVLDYYDEWRRKYDELERLLSENGWSEDLRDAILIRYLRELKEAEIKSSLSYIKTHIINKTKIEYNINERYIEYAASKEIKNPFEQIIIDIRELEEKRTQKEVQKIKNQEDVQVDSRGNIVWFSEEELALLHKTQKKQNMDDGELGGHMSYPRVDHDMSYLLNEAERQAIFERCVLKAVYDAE